MERVKGVEGEVLGLERRPPGGLPVFSLRATARLSFRMAAHALGCKSYCNGMG